MHEDSMVCPQETDNVLYMYWPQPSTVLQGLPECRDEQAFHLLSSGVHALVNMANMLRTTYLRTTFSQWPRFLSCKDFGLFVCQGTILNLDSQRIWEKPGFGGRRPSGVTAQFCVEEHERRLGRPGQAGAGGEVSGRLPSVH